MNSTAQHRGSLSFLALSAAIVGLDQLSKFAIERGLAMYQSVTVLPVLEITRLHNTGAAFSFLADAAGWQRWLFTALALIVSIVLTLWLSRIERGAKVLACAVALILGGALGNVIDRVRDGAVTDFIKLPLGWPPFNLADMSITLGIVILFLVIDHARRIVS